MSVYVSYFPKVGPVDRFTYHGGCDVIKTKKRIANNWVTAPSKYSRHIKSMFDVGFFVTTKL